MKTAGNENPNSRTRLHINPSTWSGSSEPSMLIQSGWKAGKVPAAGEVFFLTFPFIEPIRTWPRLKELTAGLPPTRRYAIVVVVAQFVQGILDATDCAGPTT
jgi:hypothetical protein